MYHLFVDNSVYITVIVILFFGNKFCEREIHTDKYTIYFTNIHTYCRYLYKIHSFSLKLGRKCVRYTMFFINKLFLVFRREKMKMLCAFPRTLIIFPQDYTGTGLFLFFFP